MWTTYRAALVAMVLAILPFGPPISARGDDDETKRGIDAQGSLASWLVLAPIPFESGEEGADALIREPIKDEGSLDPKASDKVELGGKALVWKEASTEDGVLDFNRVIGDKTENSVAYAVTTIVADDERTDVVLKVASDDQVRVYLNGKLVHANDEARSLDKDDEDNVEGLTLKKGRNLLVLKVVNEEEDWAGSVRILDKQGDPLPGIRATTKPE